MLDECGLLARWIVVFVCERVEVLVPFVPLMLRIGWTGREIGLGNPLVSSSLRSSSSLP